MGMRARGETVEEITGAARGHARARRQSARAGRRHRYLRHGRRRQGHAQYLDLRRVRGCRRRRARRQARQPLDLLALGLGRRARRARRQYRVRAGGDRALHRGKRARLHVRAGASRRHAPCRQGAGPSSARAPSSICLGRSPIRPARNIRSSACSARNGSSPSPRCSADLVPSGPGWCTALTVSTSSPPPASAMWRRLMAARSRPSGSRRRMPGCREAKPEDLSAAMRPRMRPISAPCSADKQGAFRDIVLLNAAAALLVAGKAKTLARRRGACRAGDRQRQGQGRARSAR